MMKDSLCRIIAGELQARAEQVEAAVRLLDEGNTVPFIARYRKEVTGGLDDTQLRNTETRLGYLRELEDRRQAILKSIGEQGKLTSELETAINGTLSKTELEDLYLPYKPKRRTRGQIAIEAGLEPLAELLWNEPSHDPETEAAKFIDADKGVADTKAALDGARYILMERFSEKMPPCSRKCVTICGKTPTSSLPWSAGKRKKAPSSAIISIITNPSLPPLHTARWRCSAAATKACSSSP